MAIARTLRTAAITVIFMTLAYAGNASAHCDTLDGPVVGSAREALEKGDITPVLKWVRPDDEKMIRGVFQKTLVMRGMSSDAQTFADTCFFETLVRIHRTGEGASYTGLKPGSTVDPAVALADKALESGSVDKLVNKLTQAMAKGIRERFEHARETKKLAGNSVLAGREFVKNYVFFTHYVENLHMGIQGNGGHNEPDNN